MCLRNDNKNRRSLVALASSFLVIGLVLSLFLHPTGPAAQNFLHFVGGMLIGLSGTLNLWVLWSARRVRRP